MAHGQPEADLPVTVIQRASGWHWADWRELWSYRELLYFLARRDIKVRYKETVLGVAWAVLKPLTTLVAFSLFFGRVASTDSPHAVPYPLFACAGLLPWFFFATVLGACSSSVLGNYHLLSKVYFPRFLLPVSAAGEAVADFAVALVLLVALMFWYGVYPGWSILLAPLLVFLLLAASLGVGILFAALAVFYRDVRQVVPFLTQLWMFFTPTIFLQAEDVFGAGARAWLPLNPAYGLIANFREAMLGGHPDWYALAVSAAVSVVLLAAGCLYFRWVEDDFPDAI